MTRLFLAGDLHASDQMMRKALKTSEYYHTEVVLLTGDLTGKAIVPFVQKSASEWYAAPYGKPEYYHSKTEVEEKSQQWRDVGYYAFETTPTEVEELQKSEKKMDTLFTRLMCEGIDHWMQMVEEQMPGNVVVIVSPGNDDHFSIDEVIKRHERVIYPEEQVVEVDAKHSMVSCAWVSPTPWATPRECSEDELKKRLRREMSRVQDYQNLLCNFHNPPYGTILDVAPKLDKTLKPVTAFGSVVMENVGSKAVRDVLLEYQPLLGLHGHIHEAPGHCNLGRTVCINPGSEYQKGLLRGYVIDLPSEDGKPLEYWKVEG